MEKSYTKLYNFLKDKGAHPNSQIIIKEETSVQEYVYSQNN